MKTLFHPGPGRPIRFAALAVAAAFAMAMPADAQLRVDITRGKVEPLPIAIPDFQGKDPRSAAYGRQVTEVITGDLARSGLFRPIDKQAFIQSPADIGVQPRFGDWRLINAQALVNGLARVEQDGRLVVEFRLWDVFAQQQMIGTRYRTAPDNWRVVAHRIADKIYQRITGLKTGHHRRESRLIVDHREPLPIIRPRYRRQPNFYHTARRPIEHITAS